MERLKIGDICEIVSGSTPQTNVKEYWDGDIKWITPAEIDDNTYIITDSRRKITKLGVDKTGLTSFPEGTVILSSRAPIGKVAIAGCEMYCNQGFKNLVCSEKIDNQYLYWFLKGKKDYLNSLGRGATFKEISKKVVSEININIPDRQTQQNIVKKIKKCRDIIEERKQQLELLDNLIKARFVEMFGTIYDNSLGYSECCLQDVCEQIKDGTHQTPKYTDDKINGYKFLSSKDVTSGKVNWMNPRYIPEYLHKELYARIAPKRGDILLAKNGTTGIAAIVDRDEVFDIYVSLALLRPVSVDVIYLWAAINSQETKRQFDGSLKGIGVPNLHLNEIKKARILRPPIELQEQFAAFVRQTDKSKVAIQKALDETQILFDSLMQKYFG
mgnify:CR=1 FL=1